MSGSDSPTFFHGQPWSSWIERIGRDKPLSDEETENQPSSSVTRLSSEDIDLYGFCPERDTFYGVVCEICNAIVKPQALIQHMESRHASGAVNFPPPPTPLIKPAVKTPYCKVSKLKKTNQQQQPQQNQTSTPSTLTSSPSSSSQISSNPKINHTTVKRTVDPTILSTSLPISSSPRSPLETLPIQQQPPQPQQQQPQQQQQQPQPAQQQQLQPQPQQPPPQAQQSQQPLQQAQSQQQSQQQQQQQQQQQHQSSTNNGSSSIAILSPVKSPGNNIGQPRRKRLKTDRSLLKDREYDPDRHCGVWNDETGKPCTRSLTCKAHTVSLRRTVSGRSKTFDKLLAEHRASKEIPPTRPSKVTITGTLTVSSSPSSSSSAVAVASTASLLNSLAPNTPSTIDSEAPSSPPVLSLPDTYPLPKAVDLLYRCLAPHGSTKPTKLEEDFANEELRNLESSLVNAAGDSAASQQSSQQQQQQNQQAQAQQQPQNPTTPMMAPISVVLPSLSPLPASNGDGSPPVATLISSGAISPAMPVAPAPLPASTACGQQQTPVVGTVLEGETPVDIVDADSMTIYSPVYAKDGKSQLVVHIPRSNNHIQSPISRNNYQVPASMPSLSIFEPIEQLDQQQHATQINGKRLNHANNPGALAIARQTKKTKQLNYHHQQEFAAATTAIQVEATTTSTPYPAHFGDVSWSNCHPEPLAVSRWLRITSSRKQYNFNIH